MAWVEIYGLQEFHHGIAFGFFEPIDQGQCVMDFVVFRVHSFRLLESLEGLIVIPTIFRIHHPQVVE